MEDWGKVAAEVDEAIRSVGQSAEGFPAALWREGAQTGEPFDPVFGAPTYLQLYVIDDRRQIRDASGSLTTETRRTLTVGTRTAVVPTKADKIAVGIKAESANEASNWNAILEVRPLAPAGVTLLYEVDLAT
jgi:hypothetical protein